MVSLGERLHQLSHQHILHWNTWSSPSTWFPWVRDCTNYPINAPFTGTPGLPLPCGFLATPTPVDFYQLFIGRKVIKHFTAETSRYTATVCSQKISSSSGLSPWSIDRTWKTVAIQEMTRFVAILIHMGLVKKPQIADYWSTDPTLHTAFASKLMQRDRFKSIVAFFHLCNSKYIPRGQPAHDPLFKLRFFFSRLVQVSSCLWKLSCCLSVCVYGV